MGKRITGCRYDRVETSVLNEKYSLSETWPTRLIMVDIVYELHVSFRGIVNTIRLGIGAKCEDRGSLRYILMCIIWLHISDI